MVDDNPSRLIPSKIESAVNNYIFGGTNVIAGMATDFTQIGTIHIAAGDLAALADALKSLGIAQTDVEEATEAILADGKPTKASLGARATEWVKTLGRKLGEAGMKIGTGAAQQLVTKWVLQYWGLH